MAFAAIVNLTIALEVSQGVARFYASESDRARQIGYASSAFWFTVGSYSLFALAALGFAPVVAESIMGQKNLEAAFKIGVVHIWANGLFYLIQNQFRWELRSAHYASVSIVMSVVTALVSVWLTWFLDFGLLGLLSGLAVGSVTGTVMGLYWLRASIRITFSASQLRQMLRFSTPLVVSGVSVWLTLYADRLMIQSLLSVEQVGLYGIGFRVASLAGLVIMGFQAALTPLVYLHYQKNETPEQLAEIFRLFFFFFLVILLFLGIYAIDLLRIMTTPEFYASSVVVIYLVPAILLSSMYVFSPGIAIAKKTHLVVWINVIGGTLNISLNFFLIPFFGIEGAALATLISYFSVFMLYLHYGQRYYRIPHRWWSIIVPFIVTVIFLVVFRLMAWSDAMRWSYGVAVLFSITAVAVASGLVGADVIRQVSRVFRYR